MILKTGINNSCGRLIFYSSNTALQYHPHPNLYNLLNSSFSSNFVFELCQTRAQLIWDGDIDLLYILRLNCTLLRKL